MKKKVIIIDNSNLSYSGDDINGVTLRGTETSLILLALMMVIGHMDAQGEDQYRFRDSLS